MHRALVATVAIVLSLAVAATAAAHCQIPCGIYDDEMRIELIVEHAGTIEKSMREIVALSAESPVNYNQVVRWVQNKDDHAQLIQDIVSAYFLTQRVKHPGARTGSEYEAYVKQLELLHQILVAAMKARQTTERQYPEKIRSLAEEYRKQFLPPVEVPHKPADQGRPAPERIDHGRG